MTSESTKYLSSLHKQINKWFDLSAIKVLYFELGVDTENVPRDNCSAHIRYLIVSLAKQTRLQQLIYFIRKKRPFVDWEDVPLQFELPAAIAQEDIHQVNNYTVYSNLAQTEYEEEGELEYEGEGGFEYLEEEMFEDEDILLGYGSLSKGISFDSFDNDESAETTRSSPAIPEGNRISRGGQINTGGNTQIDHIGDNINTDGGDYVAGNKTIHGNVIYGDQTIINYPSNTPSEQIEETIRLDVASPAKVYLKKIFEVAVAVRQPVSDILDVEGLFNVTSKEGVIFHDKQADLLEYRIEITGDGFEIEEDFVVLRLRPGTDSPTHFFQIVPLQKGNHILYINAYQETNVSAAQSKIAIEVEMEVTSEMEFLNFLRSQLAVFFQAVPETQQEEVDTINTLIKLSSDMIYEGSANSIILNMMCENLVQNSKSFEVDFPKIPTCISQIIQIMKASVSN